jgi:predicted metal-binding protein
MVEEKLNELLSNLRQIHDDVKLISSDKIAVSDWVRLKCRFGCRAYGKHFCCPPFAPTPNEMRRILGEYRHAILVRIQVAGTTGSTADLARDRVHERKKDLQKIVYELERKAFLSGYYKAFAMASSPCHLCAVCVAEEKLQKGETLSSNDAIGCRHKDMMRPSLEAAGIDVFQTLRNAGYDLKVLKDYSESVDLFGLVLLE